MTTNGWRFPTLADFLGMDPGTRIPCPVCGASRTAGEILDFRKAPVALRPKSRMKSEAAPFACDGCRETVEREFPGAAEKIAKSVGAPADVVAKLRARQASRIATLSAGLPSPSVE